MAQEGLTITKGDANTVIITINDVTKDLGVSGSGKSLIIASTFGTEKIDGISYNVNVYVPRPK